MNRQPVRTYALITAMAVLLASGGCSFNYDTETQEIKPSDKLISEMRTVAGFDTIRNATAFDLLVTAEGANSVEVTGSDNLVAEIETVVEGNSLIIRQKKDGHLRFSWNWGSGHSPLTIRVSTPALVSLDNLGSGDVTLRQLHGDKFVINGSGSGDVAAAGSIGELTVRVNGSGDLDLTRLASSKVNLAMNGSGDVHISGISESLDVQMNGSGDLAADTLQTERVSVAIRGSGDAGLHGAIKFLKADLSGSGNLVASTQQGTQLTLVSNGSGDMRLSGEARDMSAQLKGSGNLEARELLLERASVKVTGSGEAEVNVKAAPKAGQTGDATGSRHVKIDRSGVLQ